MLGHPRVPVNAGYLKGSMARLELVVFLLSVLRLFVNLRNLWIAS
jgi:hypothetical protein